jgi:hypothetical protein
MVGLAWEGALLYEVVRLASEQYFFQSRDAPQIPSPSKSFFLPNNPHAISLFFPSLDEVALSVALSVALCERRVEFLRLEGAGGPLLSNAKKLKICMELTPLQA